jgi:hypothetical protein
MWYNVQVTDTDLTEYKSPQALLIYIHTVSQKYPAPIFLEASAQSRAKLTQQHPHTVVAYWVPLVLLKHLCFLFSFSIGSTARRSFPETHTFFFLTAQILDQPYLSLV